jgi:hypothetical protein
MLPLSSWFGNDRARRCVIGARILRMELFAGFVLQEGSACERPLKQWLEGWVSHIAFNAVPTCFQVGRECVVNMATLSN